MVLAPLSGKQRVLSWCTVNLTKFLEVGFYNLDTPEPAVKMSARAWVALLTANTDLAGFCWKRRHRALL